MLCPKLPVVPDVRIKKIPGFPEYAAGDDGTIWSSKSCDGWKKMTPTRNTRIWKGYLQTSLTVGAKRVCATVHKMVLLTFVGPCPDGMQARHLNSDSWDNRLSNLEYATPEKNSEDRIRTHGKTLREVQRWHRGEVVKRYTAGEALESIADSLGYNYISIKKYLMDTRVYRVPSQTNAA